MCVRQEPLVHPSSTGFLNLILSVEVQNATVAQRLLAFFTVKKGVL